MKLKPNCFRTVLFQFYFNCVDGFTLGWCARVVVLCSTFCVLFVFLLWSAIGNHVFTEL